MSSENNRKELIAMLPWLQSMYESLDVERRMMKAKVYAEEHPLMTLFWVVTLAMCCIPFICFCTFICATIFFTVAGFVLIEGTIVTIATILLGGALLMVGLMALGFSSSLVLGYYAFHYSQEMIQKLTDKLQQRRQRPVNIVPQEEPQY